MRVPRLPAMGGDRLRPRRQQRRDLLQLAGQGAGRDVQPLGGQRGHDPVHRPAQHVLLMQQPGQEPGGEQPLRDHLGRRRRAGRPRPVARAAAPVAAAAQQDPDQFDLPVDQLAVLGADELVPGPAARAAPLLRFQVDDAFLGLQVRITAAAVPRRARTLPPPARAVRSLSARAVLAAPPRLPRAAGARFSLEAPNSSPLSVVTVSCSRPTSADSAATRAFSSEFSCRSCAAAASARSARARQQPTSASSSIAGAKAHVPAHTTHSHCHAPNPACRRFPASA